MATPDMNIPFVSLLLLTCIAAAFSANLQIIPAGPNVLVGRGNNKILDCFVSGDLATSSTLNYTWSHPAGANIVINDTVDTTNTTHSILTIENFNDTNAGNYTCIYPTTGGDTNKTTVSLIALTENKMGGSYSFGNQSATLTCSLVLCSGIEATFQEWLRDNISLSQLTDHDRFQQYDNGTLLIKRPTRRDGGVYIARYNVTKDYGPYYDCEVIYKAPPLVLDMDKSKSLVEGENLEMNCNVKGYPLPTVRWFKDGLELKDRGRIHLAKHDGVENASLSVQSVQYSDGGKYVCNATDDDGQNSYKAITVRIKDRLDWLWPVIGIICEAVVLIVVVALCTKFHKHHDD